MNSEMYVIYIKNILYFRVVMIVAYFAFAKAETILSIF
ncbi:hypothetical protein NMS_2108 [Nonlabens marinus S1-08]|uniref:Uncharacterized protein n=1 Tax=Nonlabens marinus S1-08 TaxID=1454201 RepID=W8VXL1_9FLAO|nr:hypothetical protein NMS_2108 [Nonlabens marinus S1-08]